MRMDAVSVGLMLPRLRGSWLATGETEGARSLGDSHCPTQSADAAHPPLKGRDQAEPC
jgi:hypothetical protein